MKTRSLVIVAVVATGLSVSGCSKIKGLLGGKPKGQVVATVNGEEITAMELRQEMGNFASRDPAVMKAAQQRAVQSLIMRHLLVQKAKEQKLDKTPDYTTQVQRGEDGVLIQLYQRKLAQSVAVPTRQEAEAYVTANPDRFSNRRIMVVDQLVAPVTPKITAQQLQPLKTLDQVRALYEAAGLQVQRNTSTIDTLQLPPQALDQIRRLPPGDIFVLPQGGGLVFNNVVETRAAPFQGDAAVAYAINILRNQKAQDVVGRQVDLMRKTAEKSIVYNEAFKPPAPGAKPAAPKPAAAVAPAAAPAPAPAAPAAK